MTNTTKSKLRNSMRNEMLHFLNCIECQSKVYLHLTEERSSK